MENLWKTVTENVGFIVVIAITAAVLFAVAKLGEMWAGVTSSQQKMCIRDRNKNVLNFYRKNDRISLLYYRYVFRRQIWDS